MPKLGKIQTLPAKYHAGFLRELDGRTELHARLMAAYTEIIDDLGGGSNLSHVKLSMIERFVFLEHIVQQLELQIATSDPKTADALMGRWVQSVNSLLGLGKLCGLEKRVRKVSNLQDYIKDAKKA